MAANALKLKVPSPTGSQTVASCIQPDEKALARFYAFLGVFERIRSQPTLRDERQKNLYLCGLQSDLKRAPGWDEPAAIGLEPVLYPLCCGCLRTLLTPSSLRVVLG